MVTKRWRKEKTPGTKSIALLAIAQVAGEGIGLPLHFSLELAAPVNFKENLIQQVGHVTRYTSGTSSTEIAVHVFFHKAFTALAAKFPQRSSVLKNQGLPLHPSSQGKTRLSPSCYFRNPRSTQITSKTRACPTATSNV